MIAATHQPLDALARDGRFRMDLLARLRGYQFFLPPLAARREDLGLLIGTLLERIDPKRSFSLRRKAARALFRYGWPLHVRELEQALRAAVAVGSEGEITLEDLPESVRAAAELLAPSADTALGSVKRARAAVEGTTLPGDDDAVLPARLAELCDRHRGNVTRIAADLATSRSHVRRLALRFGIDLDEARRR